VGVNSALGVGGWRRLQLGAQPYSSVKELERVLEAARPTTKVTAMLDDTFFDQFEQVLSFRHGSWSPL
jgi:hypothetical protein